MRGNKQIIEGCSAKRHASRYERHWNRKLITIRLDIVTQHYNDLNTVHPHQPSATHQLAKLQKACLMCSFFIWFHDNSRSNSWSSLTSRSQRGRAASQLSPSLALLTVTQTDEFSLPWRPGNCSKTSNHLHTRLFYSKIWRCMKLSNTQFDNWIF